MNNSRRLLLGSLAAIALITALSSAADARNCLLAMASERASVSAAPVPRIVQLAPAPGQKIVPVEQIEIFRLATYNVENFFAYVGKHERTGPTALTRVSDTKPKPEWETDYIARIIAEEVKADSVAVQEVEGENTIDVFSKRKMKGLYDGIVTEGNDQRGIKNGILHSTKYGFRLEVRTNAHRTWRDPAEGHRVQKLFARDVTVIITYIPGFAMPVVIEGIIHSKSKRDRPGDRESNMWREAEHDELGVIADELMVEFQKFFGKDIPLLFRGDANADMLDPNTMKALRKRGYRDVLDVMGVPVSQRITHTYHPRGGATHKQQMDTIMLSPALQKLVRGAGVHRYKDRSGNPLPIPESYQDRERQPSDHFLVWADLYYRSLIQAVLASKR